MPVGQESPTRGMGVWARVVVAVDKMKQSRYLVMGISPGCCMDSICEVETFWGGTVKLGVANRGRAEPGGGQTGFLGVLGIILVR